jgi:PRTRC genetic system ThiF family protein
MAYAVHKLNRSRTLSRMLVIGCGGTGSALIGGLPFLDQAVRAMGLSGLSVVVADGETVSPVNCVRQPFSESEIGLYKSTVLVNRLNLFWGLNWGASTQHITKHTTGVMDIIVSCVDTRAARRGLVSSRIFQNCVYWLDIGNIADGGQFVLGQAENRRNKNTPNRLPTVADLYPEIVTPLLDGTNDLPS